jgi:hypothetical protein
MEVQSARVKVAVRVRPLSGKEQAEGHNKVVKSCPKGKSIVLPGRDNELVSHGFDRAFDFNSSQMDLYSTMASPLMSHVISGFNATIFAYGQTGSGKTYTMGKNNLFLLLLKCMKHTLFRRF